VIGLFDDHAHPFPLAPDRLALSAISLDTGSGPEGDSRRAAAGPGRLAVEALRVRLARLLECPPDEVEAVRDARAASDWSAYVRLLFADAGIEEMLLDGGPDRIDPTDYAAVSHVPTRSLLRLESVIDPMLDEGAEADDVLSAVEQFVEDGVRAGVAGLKTVLAYRTGLRVDPGTTLEQARGSVGDSEAAGPSVRRRAKRLRDLVLVRTLEQCAAHRLPLQVHTGFGDGDLRLVDAEPILLDDLLRTPVASAAPVVLIHGGFPWHEQVAYLAAVRPMVWVEYSLANLMSPATTADRLLRVVDLAPTDRVLLGTDGHGPPETHWFAACVLRAAWDEVRRRLDGATRTTWLDEVEHRIFAGNARLLYRSA
jgi:uncharacterized protein